MAKSEYVKCRYSHCKHDGKPIRREDAAKSGSSYYHKDCLIEKNLICDIMDYYVENFDKTPIMSLLRKTINTIVYNKNYDAEYLMFCLRYAKLNNIPINHPAGLHYLVKNYKIINAWESHLRDKAAKEVAKTEFVVSDDLTRKEGYGTLTKSGFGRIL